MLRMIATFALILALALGAVWLADQPGMVTLRIGGWEIATSLLVAGLALLVFGAAAVLLWLTYHWIIEAPAHFGSFLRNRKRRRGIDALSRGMIAAGAGDAAAAAREAAMAERLLGEVPLTLLLKAQTAQLRGDAAAARRIFESMLEREETAVLGLRGLHTLARNAGDDATARRLAERAAQIAPETPWASLALFEILATERDWAGALEVLEARRRHKLVDRPTANRLAAVLRTAQAQEAEADNPTAALDDALEAHRLVPELVPAAVIAGRLLAEKGEAGRAARVIEETWRANPHPDLATVYTHVRPGDAPRERLKRVESLAAMAPGNPEGAIAVARAALEARAFAEARASLVPLAGETPSQRVCVLMAEIESAERGDRGRVREWLARAVGAARDPTWTADGFVSPVWRPVSPVSGRLDAFEWRVPVEGNEPASAAALLAAGPAIRTVGGASGGVEAAAVTGLAANDPPRPADERQAGATRGAAETAIVAPAEPAAAVDERMVAPLPHPPDDPGVPGDDDAPAPARARAR